MNCPYAGGHLTAPTLPFKYDYRNPNNGSPIKSFGDDKRESRIKVHYPMHRNSQKRIYLNNYGYFVTTITYKRFPYFKEKIFCKLFTEELLLSQKLKKFELYGYVIMPDHVHLLIRPNGEYNISDIMQSIKKEFSRDINCIIAGDIPECRLQGKQYSPRYKKEFRTIVLEKYHQRFSQKYGHNQIQFPPFKWQKSFRDHIIRDEKDLHNHLLYMQNNQQKYNQTPK